MISERSGGAIVLVVSLAYGLAALGIPVLPADAQEPMSARTLPLVLAGVGVLLGVALCVSRLQPEREVIGRITSASFGRASGLLAICVLYGLSMAWLGFIAASIAALAGGLLLLGERRPVVIVGVPVAAVVMVWFVLEQGLQVHLTTGSLW